jgi:Fe(3+) dicitrate transport protein
MKINIMRLPARFLFFLLSFSVATGYGQRFSVSGSITGAGNGAGLAGATVCLRPVNRCGTTDERGRYKIKNIPPGTYTLVVSYSGYDSLVEELTVSDKNIRADRMLVSHISVLDSVRVSSYRPSFGISRLKDVEGSGIYAGKKSEVIVLKDIVANTAANNTRQVYSKIAGLNIWENDQAGLQLAIGGRGLNPNRVTNFNTRQNGYDISADALGYPESYYTPPAEGLEKIEIVRGAASLQYGTQFGGMINFKMKDGPDSQKIRATARETAGSWDFFNSFNSIGGKINKFRYFAFYEHKSGKGWRPNSEFNNNTAYASATVNLNDKLSIAFQYTYMDYLEHQPGGLTDVGFKTDPRQSIRQRNWFTVNWNLGAVLVDYTISPNLKLNSRFFGLTASRSALGVLDYINRADPGGPRNLWTDQYRNWGNETRLIYTYHNKTRPFTLLTGIRLYHGHTDRTQGLGNSKESGSSSDFDFDQAQASAYSAYAFPNFNTALFAENIFRVSDRFSIIPGIRYESIETRANGYYNMVNMDLAGNIIYSQRVDEKRSEGRSFVLGGIGLSYNRSASLQFYANLTQNYRAINFNDIRIINPNMQVDPALKDEKGYSADMGARGRVKDILSYDVSLFMIHYDNRIGNILRSDTANFNIYSYRTNVSQSRNVGMESFAEADIWKLIKGPQAKMRISIFSNLSLISARYIHSKEPAYENKRVELVPEIVFKSGITFKKNKFAATWQYSYTGKQFTDATNAEFTSNAINGIIPAYYVMDISAEYKINRTWALSSSINNLTDNRYYTRRADSYPGPGIVPADGRSFYLTLQVTL